ncbi:FCD domain-containing protein, partial [Actinomyces oris]
LFTDQDRCFHTRLLQPLDNHLYLHLTEAFWAIHTLTVPLLDAPKLEDLTSTAKAHRAMLQAAHAGDTPAYRKAITDHYAPLLAVLT